MILRPLWDFAWVATFCLKYFFVQKNIFEKFEKIFDNIHCTVLYCTVLYYNVLYCIVLYCTVLYCTVPIGQKPLIWPTVQCNEWRDKMTKQRHSIRFTPLTSQSLGVNLNLASGCHVSKLVVSIIFPFKFHSIIISIPSIVTHHLHVAGCGDDVLYDVVTIEAWCMTGVCSRWHQGTPRGWSWRHRHYDPMTLMTRALECEWIQSSCQGNNTHNFWWESIVLLFVKTNIYTKLIRLD